VFKFGDYHTYIPERTDETLKSPSQKGFRAAISTGVPAKYSHDRPTVDTRPYPEVKQVAAEREKHTVLVLRTIRATSTRFLPGCHGGRSSSQCPVLAIVFRWFRRIIR
jgi:hypothetical protein